MSIISFLFSFFKYKRAELTIQWIVVAILAILFLVVLVIIFQSQLSELTNGFSNIIKGVLGSGDELENL